MKLSALTEWAGAEAEVGERDRLEKVELEMSAVAVVAVAVATVVVVVVVSGVEWEEGARHQTTGKRVPMMETSATKTVTRGPTMERLVTTGQRGVRCGLSLCQCPRGALDRESASGQVVSAQHTCPPNSCPVAATLVLDGAAVVGMNIDDNFDRY